MTRMNTFGDPARFEIAARWIEDEESRDRLPKEYGWSMGELRIKVGGVVLTAHRAHGQPMDAIHWYLGPMVSWVLRQWKWLMHEEAYTWQTRSSDSAALTVAADLERYIASEYAPDRAIYKTVYEWWTRHALRSSDSSALYPDVFIRRVDDHVEISWLDRQPEFSPEGFELNLMPGTALFSVEDVARPLWDFLRWALDTAPSVTEDDRRQVNVLRAQLNSLSHTDAAELESVHVASDALRKIMEEVRAETHWVADRAMLDNVPVVTEFDAPALMFGGLNVDIRIPDMRTLFSLLMQHRNGADNDRLASLVSSPSIYEYIQPYTHGYELAYLTREALGIDVSTAFIDIEKVLEALNITISEERLETNSVRGVAIAGAGLSPAILVNLNSRFNEYSSGRRFTLAHELCHILYDRSSARRLSHISGPWASARVEKRANAFAAMFLATPHALSDALATEDGENWPSDIAVKFGMGNTALLEHMRNMDLIGDQEFFDASPRLN
jgi:Zn-dependent peptidase ImmA (M78 family)